MFVKCFSLLVLCAAPSLSASPAAWVQDPTPPEQGQDPKPEDPKPEEVPVEEPKPEQQEAPAVPEVAPAKPSLAGPELFLHAERLWVRPGLVLENAGVLIGGGQVLAAGTGLKAPEGVRVIEGKVICAGFLDPWSTLSVEPQAAMDLGTSPATLTSDALDFYALDLERREALRAGVVAARVQAGAKSLLGGIGSVVRLDPAQRSPQAVLLGEACASASVGITRGNGGGDVFDRAVEIDRIVGALESGRRYEESLTEYKYEFEAWQKKIKEEEEKLEKDFKKAQKDREKEEADAKEKGKEFKEKSYKEDKQPSQPSPNADNQAMARVARGELPLFVEVHRASEIRALLEALRPYTRLRLVLAGATEAAPFAAELASRGVAVVLWPMPLGTQRLPEQSNQDLTLAGTLEAAGVEVLIGSGAQGRSTRELPLLAAFAVSQGLSRAAAFDALTLGAARALDVADKLGSVEAGKQADLLILDGEPLVSTTRVRYVLSAGRVVVQP